MTTVHATAPHVKAGDRGSAFEVIWVSLNSTPLLMRSPHLILLSNKLEEHSIHSVALHLFVMKECFCQHCPQLFSHPSFIHILLALFCNF